MNTDLSGAVKGSFLSALAAISDKGVSLSASPNSSPPLDFSELMSAQDALAGVMQQLSGVLPEQQFAQLETLLAGGKPLPQAAAVAGPGAPEQEQIPVTLDSLLSLLGLHADAGEPLPLNAPLPLQGQPAAQSAFVAATGALPLSEQLSQRSGKDRPPAAIDPRTSAAGGDPSSTLAGGASSGVGGLQSLGHSPVPPTLPSIESMPQTAPVHLQAQLQTRFKPLDGTVSDPAGQLARSEAVDELSSSQLHSGRFTLTETQLRTPLAGMPQLTQPVGARGWDQSLGDSVLWMVGRSVQNASLHVTPPRLGPLEIRLSLHQDQASVSFTTHSSAVKEALEVAIPRLREMFSDSNLQLVNVDVGQRDAGGQRGLAEGSTRQQSGEQAAAGHSEYEQETSGEQTLASRERTTEIPGLLDDYA